jgi:cysteine desulfurase
VTTSSQKLVYMDNHATTRVDPRVVAAMLPFFDESYGNPHSVHAAGHEARDAVDAARNSIAAALGADAAEIVFTSGATESNNLAIRGVAERDRRRGSHLVSASTASAPCAAGLQHHAAGRRAAREPARRLARSAKGGGRDLR